MAENSVTFSKPGLWNTNSYLSSGIPYITGSFISGSAFSTNNGEKRFDFPYVTKTVTIINRTATGIRVHPNSLLSGNILNGRHYVSLPNNGDSYTFTMKLSWIYVSLAAASNADYEIVAELTNIDSNQMIALTGSGLTV